MAHTTTGWAGVHAVAIDNDGKIIGNFLFDEGAAGVVLNVRNAPSPACTSSLAIANTVVDKAIKDFGWNADKFWTVNQKGTCSCSFLSSAILSLLPLLLVSFVSFLVNFLMRYLLTFSLLFIFSPC